MNRLTLSLILLVGCCQPFVAWSESPKVEVRVSGGTDLTFRNSWAVGSRYKKCGQTVSIQDPELRMSISFVMPCDLKPGTYPLTTFAEAHLSPEFADKFGIALTWRGDEDSPKGASYRVSDGEITILSVAPLSARFRCSGSDHHGTALNLTGKFSDARIVG